MSLVAAEDPRSTRSSDDSVVNREARKDQVDRTIGVRLLEPQLPVLGAGAHRAISPNWVALPGFADGLRGWLLF